MANPITYCLDRLNLGDNVKVKQRAEQFQGQLSNVPQKMFDKGPNLKAVICIQLAYESLKNYDWDMKLGAQLAGCKQSAYESVLSMVRQQLNMQPVVTMDMLAVAFGSTTMLNHANSLWKEFTDNYLSKLKGAKRVSAQKELEHSCWKGAVMYNCAKAFGNNLDKSKLHTICGCSTAELNKSIKVVKETCDKVISQLKNETTSIGRKSRKRSGKCIDEEENEEEEEKEQPAQGQKRGVAKVQRGKEKEVHNKKRKLTTTTKKQQENNENVNFIKPKLKPISGIVSMIDEMDYKNTRAYKDYTKWRSKLIDELR